MSMVTLALAAGPGFPAGSPERRYELQATLTPGGHLDLQAWRNCLEPWPARRIRPDEPNEAGELAYDPDTETWALRLPGSRVALILHAGQLRPGEYVTIREPDGTEYSYRIVGVT